ncbi:MAG: DUF502 domain-containing protein [bacterium]
MKEIPFTPRGNIAKRFRNYFGTGLLVLVPISLTVLIIIRLFQWIDGILQGAVVYLGINIGDKPIPGVGFLALILLITFVGVIARNYIGRQVIAIGDKIVTKIPIINRIYNTIQQISQAFLGERREVFKKAVLFEYPRPGIYSVGFFTQDTKGLIQDNLEEDVVSIIVLTVPNPTSGFLVFVPKDQVIELDMPVEEALKLVISGGSIIPKRNLPKII